MGELREKYQTIISKSLDYRQAVFLVAAQLRQDFACDRVSIFFKDRYGLFVSVLAEGLEGMDLGFKEGEGLVGKCVLTRKPVISNDPLHHPQGLSRVRDHYTGYHTHSLLAVPILSLFKRPQGAVELINKVNAGFKDDDAMCLTDIAAALVPLGRRVKRPITNLWTPALAEEMGHG
jgi:GAF domain-containing protein